jgi:DNA-binding CsgD family transcriptional regulator
MCKSKSVHMFANVVADATASEAWDGGSVRDGDRLEPFPLTTTRESACPPGCRVCFLARKYGLTPREVTLIALISSGKSGRAISQTLGIGMPTIRKYCGIIHGKIGTHSRLAIGLWAIREGMVKSAVQPKSGCGIPDPLTKGVPPMKSKLLQKKSYGRKQSREVVDRQQECIEDSSAPWRSARTHLVESFRRLRPRPAKTSQCPEARLPTPTQAAVKVRVFGFIDGGRPGRVVARALDSTSTEERLRRLGHPARTL